MCDQYVVLWHVFSFCCLNGFFESFFILYCFEAHGRHAWERHSWRSALRSNEGYGHETRWAQWHGTSTQSYGPTLSRYLSVCCSSYVFFIIWLQVYRSIWYSITFSFSLSLYLLLLLSGILVSVSLCLSVSLHWSVTLWCSVWHSVSFVPPICLLSFCHYLSGVLSICQSIYFSSYVSLSVVLTLFYSALFLLLLSLIILIHFYFFYLALWITIVCEKCYINIFVLSVILPVCFFVSVCCSHSLSVSVYCSSYLSVILFCLSFYLLLYLSFFLSGSLCVLSLLSFCLCCSFYHSVCPSFFLAMIFTDVLWTLSVISRTDGVLTAKLFRLRLGIEKPSNLFAHISLWCALLCSSAGAARPFVFCTERNVGWTGLPFWNWKIHSCWKPQSHARKRNKYKSRMCLTSWKQVCCFFVQSCNCYPRLYFSGSTCECCF